MTRHQKAVARAEKILADRCEDYAYGKPSENDVIRYARDAREQAEFEYDVKLILTFDAHNNPFFMGDRT